MAIISTRLPLRKRLDELEIKLSAAVHNKAPGVVELPDALFDEMAGIIEELEEKVFGPIISVKEKA